MLAEATLRTFLSRHIEKVNLLSLDEPLLSSGRLDSFHLVELLDCIEKATGKKVPNRDVALINLDSIARILTYAQRLAGSTAT